MAKEIKTIGVLTSGGDAPGMNAAVRAIVRAGISKGYRMMGIQRGYNGLINGEVYEMNVRSVSEIIHRGGTILYTARCLEFKTKEGQAKGLARCKELGIDALVVIGGDGSFMGARALANQGIPCIGLPGTIDNDIACSEYTIGYDTAMNTAVEAIDKLRDTTQSHDRCSVVEVMGHHAGYIALNVGIATGAVAVLLPEIPFDFERDILERMRQTQVTGKKHFIIIVSEGVIDANELANQIQAATGVDSRATVLGHIQRGGSPTVRDRVNASLMGYHAIDLLDKGIYNRVVAVSGDKIVDYDVNVREGFSCREPPPWNRRRNRRREPASRITVKYRYESCGSVYLIATYRAAPFDSEALAPVICGEETSIERLRLPVTTSARSSPSGQTKPSAERFFTLLSISAGPCSGMIFTPRSTTSDDSLICAPVTA